MQLKPKFKKSELMRGGARSRGAGETQRLLLNGSSSREGCQAEGAVMVGIGSGAYRPFSPGKKMENSSFAAEANTFDKSGSRLTTMERYTKA